MTEWHLGTMGYGYRDWMGVFYPPHARPRTYLQHYSKIFSAVEMDSTFYGTPRPAVVKRWAEQTPPGFIFCPKVPRTITHDMRLQNTAPLMEEFVNTMQLLGNKLGAILIQFPPDFTAQKRQTVARFLGEVPANQRYAVEFRHRSWASPETAQMLQAHNMCWASTDYIYMPKQVHVTTDFLYLRWLDKHDRFARKNCVQTDVSGKLQWWWAQIKSKLAHVDTVYGFFNNDFSGHSPATCNQLKTLIGLPATHPNIPKQGTLF